MSFLSLHAALLQGTDLFTKAEISAPRLTAEVLLCHAIKRERAYLFAHPEQELTELEWIHYGRYLHQRLQHKPLQYITGEQEFYGRPFRVTPQVLIPRPETELLVEAALPLCQGVAIDAGCGSGAIAVTLALETRAQALGSDVSPGALRVAGENAHSLNAPVSLVQCDLLTAFASASADVVISNPPYVRDSAALAPEVMNWEPPEALFAGPDGMEIYRRLIPQAARVLRRAGHLVLELGFDSLKGVKEILGPEWHIVATLPDLCGIPRVLVCQLVAPLP